jgi:Na+/H+ antiporter NhaA
VDEVTNKATTRDRVQDLYKWGTVFGIFWGLAFALLDMLLRGSPIGQSYLSLVASITTPIYTQLAVFTSKSPLLLWLSNSLFALMYVLIGYGVKITSTALIGCWSFLLQKVTQK